MSAFKSKIGSWTLSIIENTLFGFVRRIKENTIVFLEDLPENSTKFFYGLCFMLFVIILAVAGFIVSLASLIIIIVQQLGPDVNKTLVAGQAFFLLGLFLFFVGLVLITMIGKNIKIATEKATRKMVRKLEK